MNVAMKGMHAKIHSAAPNRPADLNHTGVAQSSHSMPISTGTEGDLKNQPGSKSSEFISNDYSNGRHEAYDSQIAQPAYSGHGKVQTGTTSAL